MVRYFAILLGGVLIATATLAETESAARSELGGPELTPVGAERAGNAAGTIPAWDGGITTAAPGHTPGQRLVDPHADDPLLFSITAANQQLYAPNLTEGQKALLAQYPDSWHMNVYASRRSAAYPDYVYEAIKDNASNATLITEGRGGVENSRLTSPFPLPKQGVEVIWNHNLRWRGIHIDRIDGMAPVTRRG
jgi:hypothetical protein